MNNRRVLFACATILYVFFDVANAGDQYLLKSLVEEEEGQENNVKFEVTDANYVFTKQAEDGSGKVTTIAELPKDLYTFRTHNEGEATLDDKTSTYILNFANIADWEKFKQ